jgi:hypothetical protein
MRKFSVAIVSALSLVLVSAAPALSSPRVRYISGLSFTYPVNGSESVAGEVTASTKTGALLGTESWTFASNILSTTADSSLCDWYPSIPDGPVCSSDSGSLYVVTPSGTFKASISGTTYYTSSRWVAVVTEGTGEWAKAQGKISIEGYVGCSSFCSFEAQWDLTKLRQ